MGLSINAYSDLRAVGWHIGTQAWCDEPRHVFAYALDSFPDSFSGIPVIHEAEGSLEGGCYEITEATVEHRFHAGGYGLYNQWRLRLADEFNPIEVAADGRWLTKPDPGKPFYELIWFADNEGCIGPLAATELLVDFRTYMDHPEFGLDETFRHFARACGLAANNGLIQFR